MRSSKPITVTLGKQQRSIDVRLEAGTYESASEIIRAALRALDREEEAVNEIMRAKIREALDDPREGSTAEEVFARLAEKHAARMKAEGRDI